MNTSPFQKLYLDRCVKINGNYKPTFWKPQEIQHEPFSLFGDEDSPVKPEWHCEEVILKLIAAGLELELEVGDFVREATQKELPNDPYLKKLLNANIADEARHFKGFDYARTVYDIPQQYLVEAASLREEWQAIARYEHPLLVAMALEIGVFLPFLGCSRLFGGKSLATLSRKIAEDEYRHVITNRTVLDVLGYDVWHLPVKVEKLVKASLAWAIGSLDIPEAEVGEKFDLDFVIRASEELIVSGEAPDYNDTVYIADHNLPFELCNSVMYDREIV